MDLSSVKMVVTDMDGTLLNSRHEVSPRFFELFDVLRQKGILFAAASGRQYNSIIDKLYPIKDELIVIAENGGFAMQNSHEIVSTPLDFGIRGEILDLLEPLENTHPVLCAKDNAYLKNSSVDFLEKLKEYYTEYQMLEDLKEFEGEVMKIAVYHGESSERYIYPAVRHLEGDLKVKVSGANWVDLSHKNAHKGFALEKIQKQYGISSKETMVFGDYNNDLEMLALADYSFAMANAHPNVLKAARYRTHSNDDFGVERILEQLIEDLG
ncbi:HAD family hydrolase [Poritiphilus flavus]|uniref:Cof-type HAD-IIB family hydrolase n=1 Tax=Poritiphilus flavus TaxID=2697053 RepID=A0A6L9EB91_9FLAO|nr:HAD family hydrolase [Poritiphilus flavus]NAS11980.1 Cof-type HAD-IIB family hydrolase [Poritiphilus flavus]